MPSQLSLDAYGVTYVHIGEGGLQFESEAALQLDDGSMLTLPVPTRRSEKLVVYSVVCPQQRQAGAAAA